MKRFGNYQYVGVRERSSRDEKESRSKFWNKGKWDNFVRPFLPSNCKDMVLVDVGCGAGLFTKLAEDMGFEKVIGIEANQETFEIAKEYRRKNGGKYKLIHRLIQKTIDELPAADFTVIANVHYYLTINDWLNYLDKLRVKTRYCIIVTAEKAKKRIKILRARPEIDSLRNYFSEWEEVGAIDNISTQGDPAPRNVYSICFKSSLERVSISEIHKANRTGGKLFYDEIEKSLSINDIKYHTWLRANSSSKKRWSDRTLREFIRKKIKQYNYIKLHHLIEPIIVNSDNIIIDGNHRSDIMSYLGDKTILCRRVV